MTDRLAEPTALGSYLRDRRARLDPAALGLPSERRRTPGLRREEVAQRACISPTWYTWLEQGRGGAPSADVLDRIARALMLTEMEREHVFLLGLGRSPDVSYRPTEGVSPRLQRVLKILEPSPAFVRTALWDVVGWNRAATLMFGDFGAVQPKERNILRTVFLDPRQRALEQDWETVARFVVSAFRVDAARAGALADISPLVEELCSLSPEFRRMWRENDIIDDPDGVKTLRHPVLGALSFEYSVFTVDGRPDLRMVVYNPVTRADAEKFRAHLASSDAI